MKLDLRVILHQIGLCRRSGNNDHLVVRADLRKICDHVGIRRYHAKRDVHIGKREIHFFRTFRGYRKVCKNDIHLPGFQILHAVCSFCRYIIDLNAEILSQTLCKINIVALISAVLIHVAEGVLVGEHPDVHCAGILDLIQSAIYRIASGLSGRSVCFRRSGFCGI